MARKIEPSDPLFPRESESLDHLLTAIQDGGPLRPINGLEWTIGDMVRLMNLTRYIMLNFARDHESARIDDESPAANYLV
jgi:hypothetical protein